jgi:hypothetical protein
MVTTFHGYSNDGDIALFSRSIVAGLENVDPQFVLMEVRVRLSDIDDGAVWIRSRRWRTKPIMKTVGLPNAVNYIAASRGRLARHGAGNPELKSFVHGICRKVEQD